MSLVFYEIGRVIDNINKRYGFRVSKHTCERGSAQHRQGDMGEELAFFDQGLPDAEIKAIAFLADLRDGKE